MNAISADALNAQLATVAASLPGLDDLCAVFHLQPFERTVLLLAASCELQSSLADAVAAAHGDAGLRLPTVRFALAHAGVPAWEAFAADAPLRRFELIVVLTATTFADAPYRVPERVLYALLGITTSEAALTGIVGPSPAFHALTPANLATLDEIVAVWRADQPAWPVVTLSGDDDSAKHSIAVNVAVRLGLRLCRLTTPGVDAPGERERLARLCEREAALAGLAFVADVDAADEPHVRRDALRFLDELNGATILCSRERIQVQRRDCVDFVVDRPTAPEQRRLWAEALGERASALNGQLESVIGQFSLDAASIARVGRSFGDGPLDGRVLWQRVRRDQRTPLDDLAQRLPGDVHWDDLVLPEMQRKTLHQIAAQVRQRMRVYETWGFARDGRGCGVSALFAGPSGTGKTLAAQIVASELGLDAYRIDLSSVVSKYIGETEKNLRRLFGAAEAAGAILLFDEADAIFGKRTDVRDSHDRYANIEVSYLLQRMEAYRGLAILTTNMKSAIDDAFLRRLRFVVDFPFPDAAQRAAIWQRAFPPQMPRGDIDVKRLAALNVAGGNIRSIALNAAFVAADDDAPVTMVHLMDAARTEYSKIGRSIGDTELAGWR